MLKINVNNKEYKISLSADSLNELKGKFDAVILAVAHNQFKECNVREFLSEADKGVVYDVKGILDRNIIDGRL